MVHEQTHDSEYAPFTFCLTRRFREFPACGDFRVCYLYGLSDYGWEIELDERGAVVECLRRRRDELLGLSKHRLVSPLSSGFCMTD